MIYLLDENPSENAKLLDDRTLSRQIREIAKVLCNVHHFNLREHYRADTIEMNLCPFPGEYYDKTKKIPLGRSYINPDDYIFWARECLANYKELVDMGIYCCEEYDYRFCNNHEDYEYAPSSHKMTKIIAWAYNNIPDLPERGSRKNKEGYLLVLPKDRPMEFPICVPAKYKHYDTDDIDQTTEIILSYRNYYRDKIYKMENKTKSIDCSLCKSTLPHVIKVPYPLPRWTRREQPKFMNQ